MALVMAALTKRDGFIDFIRFINPARLMVHLFPVVDVAPADDALIPVSFVYAVVEPF